MSLSRNKFRNLIRGEFSPEAPNLVWASDITYVKVKDQYMFVCVIIDLFSRRVLSYGISDTIDTVLTINTFDEAFEERGRPENLIFHSDQGAHSIHHMLFAPIWNNYNAGSPFQHRVIRMIILFASLFSIR